MPVVQSKPLLSSSAGPARRSLQTTTPFSPGARMVPMPSRGSARSAWTGRGTLKSNPAVRAGAVLRVEPARAPLVPTGHLEISQTRSVWFVPKTKSVLKGRRHPSSFQDEPTLRMRYQPLRSWLISMRRSATPRPSRDKTSNAICPVRPSQNAFVIVGWPRPAVFADGHHVFPRSADCPNPQRVDRQIEIKPSRPGWRSAAS